MNIDLILMFFIGFAFIFSRVFLLFNTMWTDYKLAKKSKNWHKQPTPLKIFYTNNTFYLKCYSFRSYKWALSQKLFLQTGWKNDV